MGMRLIKCSQKIIATLLMAITMMAGTAGSIFYQSLEEYDTGNVLAELGDSLLQPSLAWWHLAHYFLALLVCYFIFYFLLGQVAYTRKKSSASLTHIIFLWLLGSLLLLAVNSGFFPHSKLAINALKQDILALLSAALLLALLVLGALTTWRTFYAKLGNLLAVPSLILLAIGFTYALKLSPSPRELIDSTAQQPDIILIGLDGLRPDDLAYMNGWNDDFTPLLPLLDQHLKQSLVFSHAYTPLSRTFPAWMAMLSGQSPLRSGVRFNLQDDYDWDKKHPWLLPQYLKQAGYQTAWAIDDVSFANIDQRHGFETVITPKPGAMELLLSRVLSDDAMANVVSSLRIGRWLFPMNYANRGRGWGYYPSTFSSWLTEKVNQADPKRPLFLAAHFELNHWPGLFGNDGIAAGIDEESAALTRYIRVMHELDVQVQMLLTALERNARLDNAIVIFLSDHGNGGAKGEMAKDRLGNNYYVGDFSYGHGIVVDNLAESHSLLAIRGYGKQSIQAGFKDELVSLMDIAPTILSVLDIPAEHKMDGIRLPLKPEETSAPDRVVFMESGLYLPGLEEGKLDLKQDLAEIADLYRIKSNGRLVIRNEILPTLYQVKHRAAYNKQAQIVQKIDPESESMSFFAIDGVTGEQIHYDDVHGFPDSIEGLAEEFCLNYLLHDSAFYPPPFCDVNPEEKEASSAN